MKAYWTLLTASSTSDRVGVFGKACTAVRAIALLLYIAVAIAAVVGTRGLFGFEENTDAVVLLIYMGLPWSLALAALPEDGLETALQAFVIAAPIINLWLISRICRRRRRRRRLN
ncbi:MAG: hypothetical protein AAGA06_08660 [Pseudomonadota bacterium]